MTVKNNCIVARKCAGLEMSRFKLKFWNVYISWWTLAI